jgi:hypothetical protein
MIRVRLRFPPLPGDGFWADVLLSSTLDRQYGLLALRDVHPHFTLRSIGPVHILASGEPIALGRFELQPR